MIDNSKKNQQKIHEDNEDNIISRHVRCMYVYIQCPDPDPKLGTPCDMMDKVDTNIDSKQILVFLFNNINIFINKYYKEIESIITT